MESAKLKKGGFNIWAFLFTWLWYFVKGLWGKGLIVLVGQGILAGVLGVVIGGALGVGAAGTAATAEEAAGALIGGGLVGYWLGGLLGWLCTAIYCGRTANADLYIAVRQREKALSE